MNSKNIMNLEEESDNQLDNQKVRNTRATIYDGISFRSKLEVSCYKRLIIAGFEPLYEPHKFKLIDKLILDRVQYFCPYKEKKLKKYGPYPRDLMGISYTPDFYILYKNIHIYFDTKGHPNDVYPLKKKMFLRKLEELAAESDEYYMFFEPHNIGQIQTSINTILAL